MVDTLDNTYVNADLNKVADNATQINAEERHRVVRFLKYFKDFFDGNLGDWSTEPVNLYLKPGYKTFNTKYYLFHRINKDTFRKYLKHLVEIVVITSVQQSQYDTLVFIIPKK